MKYSVKLSKEIKSLVEKYNGTVVSEDVQLLESEIDWEYKNNQTRHSDLDKGHIAALSADIKARGLKNKPLVEFDPKTGMYRIVSGHHRTAAVRNIILEDEKVTKIPCSSVSFSSDTGREFFMQNENHHPPTKPHTRKDAIRFIKNMREHGFFDSANGDTEVIKFKVFSLLDKFYCRLNATSQSEVFHEAFKDKSMTRVLTILKKDLEKVSSKLFPKTNAYTWENNEYLCYGNSDNVRKSIAVALEKRVHDIKNQKAQLGKKGRVRVLTHFKSSDNKEIVLYRKNFLETEALLNKYAYGPGNVIIVSEIVFVPQVDGKKGIKEENPIVYRWNFEDDKFVKKSDEAKLAA